MAEGFSNMDKLANTYNLAYKFLEDLIGAEGLEKELTFYHNNKPNNLNDVYKRMQVSLQNKQGYMNFIAPVDEMKDILFNFDCHQVIKKFGDDYEKLFFEFKDSFPNKKFDINNKRNAWVMYSRGTLSCAKFLSTFKNYEEFDTFVHSFDLNEYTIAALPMLLEKEIFGYGFPIACDFLKEIGYMNYGKPDVHLKDIFVGLGLVDNDSDYEVFKTIVKMAKAVGKEPVIVDKLFWMIGSGKIEISKKQIGRQKHNFVEFASKQLH